jgi:hypothetical protein
MVRGRNRYANVGAPPQSFGGEAEQALAALASQGTLTITTMELAALRNLLKARQAGWKLYSTLSAA